MTTTRDVVVVVTHIHTPSEAAGFSASEYTHLPLDLRLTRFPALDLQKVSPRSSIPSTSSRRI